MAKSQAELEALTSRLVAGDISDDEYIGLLDAPTPPGGDDLGDLMQGGIGANPRLGGAPRAVPYSQNIEPLKQPDLENAAKDLVDVERKRFEKDLTLSPQQIDEKAVRAVYGPPRERIDRDNISLLEAGRLALARHGTPKEAGIGFLPKDAKSYFKQTLRDGFWVNFFFPKYLYDKATNYAELKPGATDVPDESSLGRTFRLAGTVGSAFQQEAVAEALIDPLSGTTPESRGITQGKSSPGDGVVEDGRNFLLRVLQRVERGQGMWEDMYAAGAAAGLSDANRDRLGYAGLVLDIAVPWEMAFAVPAKIGKAAKAARELGKVAPEVSAMTRFAKALRGTQVDIGTVTERVLASKIASGEFKVEDVPEQLLKRMDGLIVGRGAQSASKAETAGAIAADIAADIASDGDAVLEAESALKTLAGAFKLDEAPKVDDLAEDLVAMTSFGERVGEVESLTPVQRGFVKLAGEAVRQTARETLGDHKLVNLASGVLVTKKEADRLKAGAKKIQKKGGLDKLVFEEADDTMAATLDANQRAAMAEFNVLGRELGEKVTTKEFTQILTDWYNYGAGVSADLRHVLKGTRQFHEVVLTGARKAAASVGRSDVPIASRFSQVVEDVLTRFVDYKDLELPRSTRIILDRESSRLASNTADALKEIRDGLKDGKTVEQAVMDLAGEEYKVLTQADIDLAKEVKRYAGRVKKSNVSRLAEQALKSGQRVDAPTIALLESGNKKKMVAGLRAWRRQKMAVATEAVQDMLGIIFEQVIKDTRKAGKIKTGMAGNISAELRSAVTQTEAAIMKLKKAEKFAAYEEVIKTGRMDGPLMSKLADKVDSRNVRASGDHLSLSWVLKMRARRLYGETIRSIIAKGLGFGSSKHPVAQAAESILTGKKTQHSEAVYNAARNALYRTGLLEIAPNDALTMIIQRGGGLEKVMAPGVAAALTRARNLGLMGAVDLGEAGADVSTSAARAWRTLLRFQKGAVTHGLIVPNPAFFVTNFLGIPFMISTTLGPGKALSTIGTMFKNPDMTASLVRRLTMFDHEGAKVFGRTKPWKVFEPPRVSGKVLETPTGVYTLEEIVDSAKLFGLERTFANVEMAANVEKELALNEPGLWNTLRRSVSGWQGVLREMTSATEQVWRSAVFIDHLKTGMTLDEAARAARESAFDYGKLTEFEQKNMRNWVLFYAFARKNADAFLKALFNHPERVGAQIRFFRDQKHWWGISEDEYAGMSPRQVSSLILGADKDTQYNVDGTLNRTDAMRLTGTSVMPVPEAMFLMYHMANILTAPLAGADGVDESISYFGGQLPGPQALAITAMTGVEPTGWGATGWAKREIPQWMMETPGISGLLEYAGVRAVPLRREDKYERAVMDGGVPVTWMLPNPDEGPTAKGANILLGVLNTYLGRMNNSIAGLDKAMRYITTDASIDAVKRKNQEGLNRVLPPELAPSVGLRASPVRHAGEVKRRQDINKERELQKKTRAVRDLL